jgi:TonB family protein
MWRVIALFLSASIVQAQSPATEWAARGRAEYQAGRYPEAVQALRQALELDPNLIESRLLLAWAHLAQRKPGQPDSETLAREAEGEFQRVLSLDPNNSAALAGLANLTLQMASELPPGEDQDRLWDQADLRFRDLARAEPGNKMAPYSLGVIAWNRSYPQRIQARAQAGMKPEDPGPLRDAEARRELAELLGPRIDQGLANLHRALSLDPQFEEAMAYIHLLLREKADLEETEEAWRARTAEASQFARMAAETKRLKASRSGSPQALAGSPPPAHSGQPPVFAGSPTRVTVTAEDQASRLVRSVKPEYPARALEARIQGVVRMSAVIGADGRVRSLQLISGHPLLIDPAAAAVRQWQYQPLVVQGQAVEVLAPVEVVFELPPQQ